MLEIDEIIYRLQLLADHVDESEDLEIEETIYFRDAIKAAVHDLHCYDVLCKEIEQY